MPQMSGSYLIQQRIAFLSNICYHEYNDFNFSIRDRLPYDQTTILGFGFTLIWQELGAAIISIIFALKISLFLSLCWFYIACISDIRGAFVQIDYIIRNKQNFRLENEIKKHLVDIITVHIWSSRLIISNFLK